MRRTSGSSGVRRFCSGQVMDDNNLILRYAGNLSGHSLEAILEGVPRGVAIDGDYVSHQVWRMRRVAAGQAPERRSAAVTIERGVVRGKTSGTPLVLAIATRRLGSRADEPISPGCEWTLEWLAPELAALTFVRKMLEDGKLFVGSRALDPGPAAEASLEEEGLGHLLAASCGAYKITEQADRSPSRVIRFGQHRKRRSGRSRAFELFVSGPAGWTRRTARPFGAVVKALARRLLLNELVESVSAGALGGTAGLVEVLRLRAVLSQQAVRADALSASLCSVLAETMVVPDLALSVKGWRIGGLSEVGPFSSSPSD